MGKLTGRRRWLAVFHVKQRPWLSPWPNDDGLTQQTDFEMLTDAHRQCTGRQSDADLSWAFDSSGCSAALPCGCRGGVQALSRSRQPQPSDLDCLHQWTGKRETATCAHQRSARVNIPLDLSRREPDRWLRDNPGPKQPRGHRRGSARRRPSFVARSGRTLVREMV